MLVPDTAVLQVVVPPHTRLNCIFQVDILKPIMHKIMPKLSYTYHYVFLFATICKFSLELPYVASFAPTSTMKPRLYAQKLDTSSKVNHHSSLLTTNHDATQTTQRTRTTTKPLHMVVDASSLITAVETFDGSTIADPVVVSSVFWSSLQTRIVSVIIGQILATIVFSALCFVVSTQLTNIGDYVSEKVFRERRNVESSVKENVGRVVENVKTKA